MAVTTGDSAVAAPIESSAASTTNMGSVAVDNQVGAGPSTEEVNVANDQIVASLGLPTSDQLFEPEDTDDQVNDPSDVPARAPHPSDDSTTREPDVAGKERNLSPENQDRLKDLKIAGEGAYNDSYGDLAETQKALQEQADKYGTNPDGSPKVNILAYQTRDVHPETSFYVSFADSKMGHTVNQEFLEYSRKHQTEYPSRSVGHVGTVISDRRDGIRL